ncbi:aminoglycoside 6-adenylyltransferase [Lacticaseibacillus absianus]|uniref:aminoglycoside 6-adenylyltransferase n=1 Tax=Lacticaseibacillus absianus TaxID=2729623 RepID=UPI0015CC3030|nr:aminoglycoside 6-adenylyltransferase [Lacticaseibacillus absianus]
MTDLARLIDLAQADPNVQAIGTEGARNDHEAVADAWTDLDVTLFVRDLAAADGHWWLHQLGTPTLVQHLTDTHLFGPDTHTWESWLTRYSGTRRIDLKLAPVQDLAAYLAGNSLNTLVWQRDDGRLTARPTSAASHWVPVPTQTQLNNCANEFYWCAGNVVKGLARGKLLYANEQFNAHVRPELLRLLSFKATLACDGHFDAGVSSKFLWATLTPATQSQLAATYAQTDLTATRRSLDHALTLFETTLDGFVHYASVPYRASAVAQLRDWLATPALFAR